MIAERNLTQAQTFPSSSLPHSLCPLIAVQEVWPHLYEEAYLSVVHEGSEYIAEATLRAWSEDEAIRRETLAGLPAAVLADEAARVRRARATRVSWWAQDVEDGYVYPAADASEGLPRSESVSSLDSALSLASAPEQQQLQQQLLGGAGAGASATVGSLLQHLVRGWAGADAARVRGELASAARSHAQGILADRARAAAAEAARAVAPHPQLEETRVVDGEDEEEGDHDGSTQSILAGGDITLSLGAELDSECAPSAWTGVTTTFSLGGDGAFELASSSSAPSGSESSISMADVLSDAMTSLNAVAREGGAPGDLPLPPGAAPDHHPALFPGCFADIDEEDDEEDPADSGRDGQMDSDDAAAAVLALARTRGPSPSSSLRGAPGSLVPRMAGLSGGERDAGGNLSLSTPRSRANSQGSAVGGPTHQAGLPTGCPFGGLHIALLPEPEGESEADSEQSAPSSSLASALGISSARHEDDERAVDSLAGLFGSSASITASDDSDNNRTSLAAAVGDAVASYASSCAPSSTSLVPTLVFDKATGEATMVTVALSGSSGSSPSLDSPGISPVSDDIHGPEAFAPLAEVCPAATAVPVPAQRPAAPAPASQPLYACAGIPIAARVGPFSPARMAIFGAPNAAVGAPGDGGLGRSPRQQAAAAGTVAAEIAPISRRLQLDDQ